MVVFVEIGGQMNWPRILLCGLLAGSVWSALSIFAVMPFSHAFFASLPAPPSQVGGGAHLTFIAANLVSGIWSVWLFALVRLRQPRIMIAVLVSTTGWWVIVTQQSIKWLALSGVAIGREVGVGIGFATFMAMLLSVMAGGWAYDRQPPRAAR